MTTKHKYAVRGQLREAWVVAEWRDGCVWRTKSLGLVVCTSFALPVKDDVRVVFGSPSTKDMV